MNSILINSNVLRIPLRLAQKTPISRHALEHLVAFKRNANNIRSHVVQSFPRLKSIKYFTPFCEKYIGPFLNSYSLLNICRNKNPINIAQLGFHRNFCKQSMEKPRSDKKNQHRKDEICGEDCVSFKKDKVKKKRTIRSSGISFNVNLNNLINELTKKKDLQKLHEINKISNFVIKPLDCKTCNSKKKKSSGKSTRNNQQKRSNSSFSVPQKLHARYEMKKNEFKTEIYDDVANYKPSTEFSSVCLDKYAKTQYKRAISLTRIDQKSKGPVPLFMLIKCNSGRTRSLMGQYSGNIKYRVGTNEAFIKTVERSPINGKTNNRRSKSTGDINQGNKLEKFLDHQSDGTKKVHLIQTKIKDDLAQLPKPILAKAIFDMLTPLIEQEHLHYKEVKAAIQRLECNLESYLNHELPKAGNSDSRVKENQLPQDEYKIIREPDTQLEMVDPTEVDRCKKDPVTTHTISAPSLNKSDIYDPREYEIVIIAENCGNKDEKSGSENPCAKKLKINTETDDSCKKKPKAQLCEEDKKKTCETKKKDGEDKKKDSCQKEQEVKEKPKAQLCEGDKKKPCETKKKDGGEKKKDSCQKEQEVNEKPKAQLCGGDKKKPCETKKKDGEEKKKDSCQKEPEVKKSDNKCAKKADDTCKTKPASQPCDSPKKKGPSEKERQATFKASLANQLCDKPKRECQKKEDPCKKEKKCENEHKTDSCEKKNKQAPCQGVKQEKKCGNDQKKDLCKNISQISDDCCMKGKKHVDLCGGEDKQKKHGEEASLSQEPKLPPINSSNKTKPEVCNGNSANTPICTQRSCTQKSMEPTEAPNCCKPLARKGFYDNPCSDKPDVRRSKIETKQVCCQEIIEKEQAAARALEEQRAASCPKPPPPAPKKSPPKIDPPSKADTRYCTKPASKLEETAPPKEVKCPETPAPAVPQGAKPKPIREPKQALKDFWFPVKIRTKKLQTGKHEQKKQSPKSHHNPAPSRSPKLTAQLPKQEPPKSNLMDNCKGLFTSICKVFGPGRNKSGKRGASSLTTNSTPDLKGTFGGISTTSGHKKRKPGTMTFAVYSRRNQKYPWSANGRWSVHQERFFSKKSEDNKDPCESKKAEESEEVEPHSNKLQCICYEEIKKKQAQIELADAGKKSDHCRRKTDKKLCFKPTNHSKICQRESKKEAAARIKPDSQKSDQSIFNQCGELCKQNKNGKSKSSGKSSAKNSVNVCAHKLKTSGADTKSKTASSEKPKSESKPKDSPKKRKTFMERCKSKIESKKDVCKKDTEKSEEIGKSTQNLEQNQKKAADCPKDIRSKYPWKKSDEKMDGNLCGNESISKKETIEKVVKKNEKDGDECQRSNKLEIETDTTCFREFDSKNSKKGKDDICSTGGTKDDAKCKNYNKEECKQKKEQTNSTKKATGDDRVKPKNEKEDCKGRSSNKIESKSDTPCSRDPKVDQKTEKKKSGNNKEQKKDQSNDARKCAQPIPCDTKIEDDGSTKQKVVKKISCDNKVKMNSKQHEEKKNTRNGEETSKKAAEVKESICERIKRTKKEQKSGGKECQLKKSGSEKPKTICERVRERKKSKQEDSKNDIPTKCASSTKAKDSTSHKTSAFEDDVFAGDDDNMFICKVKSLGKSEQLICSAGSDKPQREKFNEKGVLRILKCKLTKDEYGRDVFVCKEIKPDKDKSEIVQDELEQMKELLKQRLSRRHTVASKKLVCQEDSDGVKECHVKEVKEIVDERSRRTARDETKPKKCPFTYQDLVERSEQVRKAASESALKEKNKLRDAKRVTSVPKMKPTKKKDC